MMTAASIVLESRSRRSGVIAQSKMTGAMITPAASVSHHFAQVPIEMTGESAKPKALARTGAAMAMPELITAGSVTSVWRAACTAASLELPYAASSDGKLLSLVVKVFIYFVSAGNKTRDSKQQLHFRQYQI
jgi:hypothetical protein